MLNIPKIRKKITNGLVGWWSMDNRDIAGSSLSDKSGNNNTATIVGAISEQGIIRESSSFDGNDYIVVTSPSFTGLSVLSMFGWIKFDVNPTPGNPQIIFDYGGASGTRSLDFFRHDSNNKLGVAWNDGFNVYGNTTLVNDVWYFVGVNVNDTAVEIFLNGISDGAGSIESRAVGNAQFAIGVYNSLVELFHTGNIDDARVYNRTLSNTEIRDLYHWRG